METEELEDNNQLLAEYLDTELGSVVHITLLDKSEIIGEVIVDEPSGGIVESLLVVNPIKLEKITTINNDTLEEHTHLLKWSEVAHGPWTNISKHSIVNFHHINPKMMNLYLSSVIEMYYDPTTILGEDFSFTDDEELKDKIGHEGNVINFDDWL